MNRIDNLFSRLRSDHRRALMPFVTAGDPDLSTTAMLITELVNRGAHLIEVGIPYSDPIADGPVIAASYHRALERGVKVAHIFQTLRTLRAEGSAQFNDTPLVSMVSYAIIHRLGAERYLNEAATAGLDGLIVPDLPVEESRALVEKATRRNLKLIQLITPTTPRERAVQIAQATTGFIYYVSVAGITGERKSLPSELVETVGWIRQRASEPPATKRAQPWTTSWAGRLIALAARLLPPELRYEFVEDQCGNLAGVESRREWLGYLLGLVTRMPRIAAAASPGRSRW